VVTVDTLNQRFGNVIRARRQAQGVGQEALADLAGLHRTYISMLERGLRNPSLEVIEKIAGALETSMASLVGEVEEERKRGGGKRR
jgi:transcriptional regulator with XRE-family HTH domain